MSDFYQILKREIEPAVSLPNSSLKEDALVVKKTPVDNSTKKNIVSGGKKIKPTKKIKKKSLAKKKSGAKSPAKKSTQKKEKNVSSFLTAEPANPIWLTMAEAAKLGGIKKRTIKRALRAGAVKYRIVESRYQVDLRSVLLYFYSKKKLWNKLLESGIGQYVEEWKSWKLEYLIIWKLENWKSRKQTILDKLSNYQIFYFPNSQKKYSAIFSGVFFKV